MLRFSTLPALLVAFLGLFLPVQDAAAQLHGFSKPRPMPPGGWSRLDWPEKRQILFGNFAPSEEEIGLIAEAMPEAPATPPAEPRKLLVFYRCQYPHVSIATGTKTFEMMGEKTDAFAATLSDDPAIFTTDKLADFDAVLLNNTTSFERTIGPAGQTALISYVASGGGLVGIHAAADSCQSWPEGAKLFGGIFAGHPWTSKGTWAFRLESPGHRLNQAFGGRGFSLNDEVYLYRGFSAERSRVLVSLDMSDNKNQGGKGFHDKLSSKVHSDERYPVAWVHRYKKGRVFYSNLGHNPTTYWQPSVLQHYLDGIRFALGDLHADTASTAEVADRDLPPVP